MNAAEPLLHAEIPRSQFLALFTALGVAADVAGLAGDVTMTIDDLRAALETPDMLALKDDLMEVAVAVAADMMAEEAEQAGPDDPDGAL